jgi:hypothetical protein
MNCVVIDEKTRCYLVFYYTYGMLNMFWAPLCPSSGAHDYITVHHMERLILGFWWLVVRCGLTCYVTGLMTTALVGSSFHQLPQHCIDQYTSDLNCVVFVAVCHITQQRMLFCCVQGPAMSRTAHMICMAFLKTQTVRILNLQKASVPRVLQPYG